MSTHQLTADPAVQARSRQEEARRITDDVAYRIFRLYLAGARQGSLNGTYNLYQTLLAKPDRDRSGLPLTRDDWYVPRPGHEGE